MPKPNPPINPLEPMAIQSRTALMGAAIAGLLSYHRPYDTRAVGDREELRGLLGEDMNFPSTEGVYYLAFIPYEQDGAVHHEPVLIPEGEVRGFVLALAMTRGPEVAHRFVFMEGLLPL